MDASIRLVCSIGLFILGLNLIGEGIVFSGADTPRDPVWPIVQGLWEFEWSVVQCLTGLAAAAVLIWIAVKAVHLLKRHRSQQDARAAQMYPSCRGEEPEIASAAPQESQELKRIRELSEQLESKQREVAVQLRELASEKAARKAFKERLALIAEMDPEIEEKAKSRAEKIVQDRARQEQEEKNREIAARKVENVIEELWRG